MSRFLSEKTAKIKPYTPGEQPRDMKYIKLNTNENPYAPAPEVRDAILSFNYDDLRLYPDPTSKEFRAALAAYYDIKPEQVFAGGGSDEVLAYAFMAFFSPGDKVYFPDITYGFYEVYADLFSLTSIKIPLQEDFSININDYFNLDGNIFIANPNAPTGICLDKKEIEEIVSNNKDRLVIIDEAYIDFSNGNSCVNLIDKYDNLLIVQTFSKNRGLAGMRIGAGFGCRGLIEGLNRIQFSFNPYNLDRISLAVGIATLKNRDYITKTTQKIINTRNRAAKRLQSLDFEVLPSQSNFIFARSKNQSGKFLFEALRKKGILVRHFDKERIDDFLRITIGTDEEMDAFFSRLEELL